MNPWLLSLSACAVPGKFVRRPRDWANGEGVIESEREEDGVFSLNRLAGANGPLTH
jgi:hypothetical protein